MDTNRGHELLVGRATVKPAFERSKRSSRPESGRCSLWSHPCGG